MSSPVPWPPDVLWKAMSLNSTVKLEPDSIP
jgi:hypothetical protein